MEFRTLKEFLDKTGYSSYMCNKCKEHFELTQELINWNNSSLKYDRLNNDYEIDIKMLKDHC